MFKEKKKSSWNVYRNDIKIRLEHAAKIQNGSPAKRTDTPNRSDFALNERLKQVYVTSENTVITNTLYYIKNKRMKLISTFS